MNTLRQAALVITLALVAFYAGRQSVDLTIDAETRQEIRSEAADDLYMAVDSCASDTCVEAFSREIGADVIAK